jgi:hypothetical protein
VLGVKRWRELVKDKEKRRSIVQQAKAHSGLQRQRKKKKKKCSGNSLPTFRDNLSVSFSRVKNARNILVCHTAANKIYW